MQNQNSEKIQSIYQVSFFDFLSLMGLFLEFAPNLRYPLILLSNCFVGFAEAHFFVMRSPWRFTLSLTQVLEDLGILQNFFGTFLQNLALRNSAATKVPQRSEPAKYLKLQQAIFRPSEITGHRP